MNPYTGKKGPARRFFFISCAGPFWIAFTFLVPFVLKKVFQSIYGLSTMLKRITGNGIAKIFFYSEIETLLIVDNDG